MPKLFDALEPIASKIAEQQGLELVDIEMVRSGSDRILRVSIDKPGGVGLTDCEKFSEPFGNELDVIDPIKERYYLEVSSPGPERPLRKDSDFTRFAGSEVEIRLKEVLEGKRVIKGRLAGLENQDLVIVIDGVQQVIPRILVTQAKLKPDFDF
ncbi:MAG TPA: ribosome maturation factor RimP [Firmicutes bacterium]|nr:ribosome maturation factor RimP [Bacillota bacterium]HBL48682.1 ribosome maturation factor RimP [Bacillota bacterium]